MSASEVVLVKGEALMDTVPPPGPLESTPANRLSAPIGYGSRPVEIYVFSGTD